MASTRVFTYTHISVECVRVHKTYDTLISAVMISVILGCFFWFVFFLGGVFCNNGDLIDGSRDATSSCVMQILSAVKRQVAGLRILTDVHESDQVSYQYRGVKFGDGIHKRKFHFFLTHFLPASPHAIASLLFFLLFFFPRVFTFLSSFWCFQCEKAAEVVDILQIPAFLCRQVLCGTYFTLKKTFLH